ncbi:chemotaxis protein CheR [Geomonas sp. Red32]|uniref:chemotaxis protein CheR n=1 Tax=Geomonas sp. Red32 TaxID=2912856 RepID=UPI00202CFC50|nr:chemotaxis protein CheR [Geomonas sp. Red32]MCM0080701.1 chemotaxis protein CheR [Geomonas sp. Red32]
MELRYRPTLDRDEIERRLGALLVPGPLDSPALFRRIERLGEEFRRFAASFPLPMWAPGLLVTGEMRAMWEAYFPVGEVARLFAAVLGRGCRFAPLFSATYLATSPSWPDLLARLADHDPILTLSLPLKGRVPLASLPDVSPRRADPAATLVALARDEYARRELLFTLFLPRHFGGSFDRYPGQTAWVTDWLREERGRLGGSVRALDSACGSGEGSYCLAEAVLNAGCRPETSLVTASTLEQFELFAGAHAFLPHDPQREREYRARVAPILEESGLVMEFKLEEVGALADQGAYDVVVCNGLLGGPLLHEQRELAQAVHALAARVAPGGVLLAADRFHAGWRRLVPWEMLKGLLVREGLELLEIPEGIGGRRKR